MRRYDYGAMYVPLTTLYSMHHVVYDPTHYVLIMIAIMMLDVANKWLVTAQ